MLAAAVTFPALAADSVPTGPVNVTVRQTVDQLWEVKGGNQRGSVTLSKFQVAATLDGDALGLPGFSFHAQAFHTGGAPLTTKSGDIQTISNIEALTTNRLFEAWAEKSFGAGSKSAGSLRIGLIDLNGEFDSIDPAGLFLNSSHGIGPDISKSGRDGPSIFPVSAFAARLSWNLSDQWALRAAAFDGVSGDPARPKAFAAVQLRRSDGALLITQADYHPNANLQISAGAWTYTSPLPDLTGPAGGTDRNRGLYGFVSAPIPKVEGLSGWIRVGRAASGAQVVDGYFGTGMVFKGPFGRSDDQVGIAVGRAEIGAQARAAFGLAEAETTWEATYQMNMKSWLAIQPDVQYVDLPPV
jgi:porin